mmetsp:Transcript_22118/g.72831  ORF Transcript_22118/g.72831 Transcript_22118/m.72831 type:complete len:217 (+) Transcript_22118:2022-2672(+)
MGLCDPTTVFMLISSPGVKFATFETLAPTLHGFPTGSKAQGPPVTLQCPSPHTYGYSSILLSPPLYMMYSKAWDGRPPLHPLFLKSAAQSTSCCSLSRTISPVLMACRDSRAAAVEKVQQLPQVPWFFTIDTHEVSPHVWFLQSNSSATIPIFTSFSTGVVTVALQFCSAMSLACLNSSQVRSLYWFSAALQVVPGRELIASTSLRDTQKDASLLR